MKRNHQISRHCDPPSLKLRRTRRSDLSSAALAQEEAIQLKNTPEFLDCFDTNVLRNDERGFTLIELSITLVIIGLIIGGVLMGKDMINAAQVRQVVSQVGQFHSAVHTFRSKYGAIPGDIPSTSATAFGIFAETTLAGQVGHGDGNGLIEGDTDGIGPNPTGTMAVGETLSFWRHLTDAQLIGGAYGMTGPNQLNPATGQAMGPGTITNMVLSLPESKLGRNTNYLVYSAGGLNYYQLIAASSITAATGVYGFGTVGLTPVEAFNIDEKMDDGAPNTGAIRARALGALDGFPSWDSTGTVGESLNGFCVMGGNSATDNIGIYNRVMDTGGQDPSCSVRFQFN